MNSILDDTPTSGVSEVSATSYNGLSSDKFGQSVVNIDLVTTPRRKTFYLDIAARLR